MRLLALSRIFYLSFPIRMTQLSVNINKFAVLRNSRGGSRPNVVDAARAALLCGAHGITVHPRPDARHIRSSDVIDIAGLLRDWPGKPEFNIEGNPLAPSQPGYPGLLELVRQTRPAQVTLVPDADGQITSDHGWRLTPEPARLREWISECRAFGARISLFMDTDSPAEAYDIAKALGADRVELYTGPYAQAFSEDNPSTELSRCVGAASHARRAGLGVNAGHDLDLENLSALLIAANPIDEVSIGHALICDALEMGFETSVRAYLDAIEQATKGPFSS